LRKLVNQLRLSGCYSEHFDSLVAIMEDLGLSDSALPLSYLIGQHLKAAKISELIHLLGNSTNHQQAASELHDSLRSLNIDGKLSHITPQQLIELYGNLRQTKNPTSLKLFLVFANIFHLDSVIIDAYDNWKELTGKPPNQYLEEIYIDSLLRLPLKSLDPLNAVFKKFSDNPLAEIKLCIKKNELELAYRKFEAE